MIGPSASGTLGTSTLEYEDANSARGYADDIEYIVKGLGNRVHSYNPRNQLGQRLHKTIDENVIMNRLMSANKNGFRRESHQDETVEDRMRIFEDEIIKRIKVIQSFVKTLDGKVKRMQANQKGNQESHRKSH